MGKKFDEFSELAVIEDDDISLVLDVSDTTDSPEGSTKRITLDTLRTYLNA